MPSHFLRSKVSIAALFFLSLTSLLRAQTSSISNDQATPIPGAGHDYIKMLNETVNPANGQVTLHFDAPLSDCLIEQTNAPLFFVASLA